MDRGLLVLSLSDWPLPYPLPPDLTYGSTGDNEVMMAREEKRCDSVQYSEERVTNRQALVTRSASRPRLLRRPGKEGWFLNGWWEQTTRG